MRKKHLIILLFLSFNSLAQTDYFVDKVNGNDSNNGTSLITAWKTIQKSATVVPPNSIVHIKAGVYFENVDVTVSGTYGKWIVFKNYQNDLVAIDGTGTSGSTLLKITNKSYLRFENITIQNKTVNDAQGIIVETTGNKKATDLTFRNLIIKNINWTNNPATIPNANKNAQGFIAYGRDGGIKNLIIDSCEVFNNILGFSEALAINGNVDGFVVKNCSVHNNNNIGIDIIGHEGTASIDDEARNGEVKGNICYKNFSPYATSAGIYVDGAKNILIEKNRTYQNGSGIEIGAELDGTVSNITIKNNLIYQNELVGLSIGGYDSGTTGQVINCVIRNNTFYQNNTLKDGSGEIAMTKASNCLFENNIFYTNNQNVLMAVEKINPQSGNTFNYNNWYTPNNNANDITVDWRGKTYSTFASYQAGTAQEGNSFYGNPSFVSTSDFHLTSGSNSINKGNPNSVLQNGETDFDGMTRLSNSRIDIGAYEYTIALGIEDYTQIIDFNIYPNPAVNTITIQLAEGGNTEIELYNSIGQRVLNEKIQDGESIIDISNLLSGVYFITVKNHNKFNTRKLIISN